MTFDLSKSPEDHFADRLKNAEQNVEKDFNAMSLATVSAQGQPTIRTVYYKGLLRGGLCFYTNYHSQKSKELLASPKTALLFFWKELHEQVRIEGIAEKLTREESETYFKTRPRLSQIGAWASEQSSVIKSSDILAERVASFESKFAGQEVPCPPHWGGFHVLPLKYEFWFGREGRLHERYVYERSSLSAPWQTSIKSP
jgi:pyridoxamine 5'-phosphate oxidase